MPKLSHKSISFFAAWLALAPTAGAATAMNDFSKTINRFGLQAPNTSCFSTNEAWSLPCVNGNMYIDLSNPAGRAMLASIIASKKTGGSITWINYSMDTSNNACLAALIEFQ